MTDETMPSSLDAESQAYTASHTEGSRIASQVVALLTVAALVALILFSIALALTRIYQVDEAQNLYMARISWLGTSREFFTSNALHLFPLGWLTTWSTDSATMFSSARLAFVVVFWLNTILLAKAVDVRLTSVPGLVTVAAAAMLAPMWDYGIELRHENLLLCGLLVMWIVGRRGPAQVALRMSILGALCVLLNFIAAKAVVYTIPLCGLLMLQPPSRANDRLLKRVGSWAAGALAGFLIIRFAYEMLGAWPAYLAGMRAVAAVSAASAQGSGLNIVSAGQTLGRLVSQVPLLIATTLVALAASLRAWAAIGFRLSPMTSPVVESAWLVAALAAFLVNPAPFAYNLLLLVPFAFVASAKWVFSIVNRVPRRSLLVLAPLVVAAHCIPFARATARHVVMTNQRQVLLMQAAEALTDKNADRVYDAVGMVVSRKSIHRWWYLHSLSLSAYGSEVFPTVAKMLSERPAAVVIMSYRTGWIRKADIAFIEAHYVPLADDFWVLGTQVEGSASWECLWAGRYALRVAVDKGQAPPRVRVDGQVRAPGVLELSSGPHSIEVEGGGSAEVSWIGPTLDGPIALPPGEPRRLFVNWY